MKASSKVTKPAKPAVLELRKFGAPAWAMTTEPGAKGRVFRVKNPYENWATVNGAFQALKDGRLLKFYREPEHGLSLEEDGHPPIHLETSDVSTEYEQKGNEATLIVKKAEKELATFVGEVPEPDPFAFEDEDEETNILDHIHNVMKDSDRVRDIYPGESE